MANPYESSTVDTSASGTDHEPQSSASHPLRGLWYLVMVPASLLYTFAAREVAGPSFTTAPNQGAMVVFFLAAIAWPAIAVVLMVVIWWITGVRGILAAIVGLVTWIASSMLPFWIGMK